MTTAIDRKVAAQQATEDRLRLLSLGYTPLPARGKLCLLEGWPHVTPDRAVVEKWKRNLDLCSSGIRLEGRQIAIDLDVMDANLVEQMLDKLWDHWPDLDNAPQRIGRAPKVLYLAQLPKGEAALTVMSTKHWVSPSGEPMHVEVFGGGRSRFIGWCGPHTVEDKIGPDGWVVHRTYDDAGTLVPAEDLPMITMATLRAWLEDCDTLFQRAGYVEHRPQAGASAKFVRDIEEDMVFDCDDGVIREGVAAMVDYADNDRNARCALSFLDKAATNTTRCRVSLADDGELRIFDFGDWVTHAPVVGAEATKPVAPASLGGLLASLGLGGGGSAAEATAEAPEPEIAEVGIAERTYIDAGGDLAQWMEDDVQSAAERFEDAFNELLYGMVYDTTEEVTRRIDDSPEIGLAASRRMDSYTNRSLIVVGPKGGRKKINPMTAWTASRKRLEVSGIRFTPGESIIYAENGRRWLNTWREPEVDPARISHDAILCWLRFMEHLIPDEREREWFERFVAHKFVNPRFRGAGVLMVAASTQGAGRSTLMAALGAVFGDYVARISSAHLFDASQRNGWMEKALWAFGNEVKFSVRYSDRVEAYERLKDLVDPAQNHVRLDEKFQRPHEALVYTSYLLATNRHDALPLPPDDRRFAIITNGGKMPEEMKEELYGQWYVRGVPGDALTHSLRAYYRSRGTEVMESGQTDDLVDAPRWFAGRAHMIEAGESDVDQIFRAALGRIPPGQIAIRRDDLEKLLLGELRVQGMETKRPAIRQYINGLHGEVAAGVGWELLPGRIKVGYSDVKASVACRSGSVSAFMKLTPSDRERILKGTDPVGVLGTC